MNPSERAPNRWLRLFLPFAAGYFFSYFLRNANAVIAPDLTRELGLSGADLGLLTGAYLAAFGLAQLPLGMLLDRFGPRRVEAALLVIAALGCLGFALGQSVPGLMAARALIGLGVSACLMGAFATFSRWWPAERQPSLNGAVMAAGALGALFAASPMAAMAEALGWRGTFGVMAAVGFVMAGLIYATPERVAAKAAVSVAEQWRGVRHVYASAAFWRFAPQSLFMVGGFMALQSLWAVPFLTVAEGLTRDAAAQVIMLSAVGMLAGFLAVAFLSGPLIARGIALEAVLGGAYALGALALLLIALRLDARGALWLLLGACYGVANLGYALLQKHFDLSLAGRVNTALNLMAFVGAFGIQWLFGIALDLAQGAGIAPPAAHQGAFLGLVALQALGTLWFWFAGRAKTAMPSAK